MKNLLLFLCLIGFAPAWGQKNTEISQVKCQTTDSNLVISYELRSEYDTTQLQQLLLILQPIDGDAVPFCLISDSISLHKGEKIPLKFTVHFDEIIDSTLKDFLLKTGRLPNGEMIAYSSFSTGRSVNVQRIDVDVSSGNCKRIKNESLGNNALILPNGDNFISDSLRIQLIPTPGRNKSAITEFMAGGADTIWFIPKSNENSESNQFYFYSIEYNGYRLCRSQNMSGDEITPHNNIQLPKPNPISFKPKLQNPETKKLLKDLYRIPVLKGTLLSESRLQSYQTPYSVQNPNYSRLYLDAQLNALVIPLKIKSMVTTEHNSDRKLNFLQIEFDREAWINQQNMRRQYLEAYIFNEKSQLDSKEKQLNNELFRQMEYVRSLNNKDSLLALKSIIRTIPDSLAFPDSFELPDIPISYLDSLNFDQNDSLDRLQESVDTSRLFEERAALADSIAKIQAQIQRVQFALDQVKSGREKLSNLEDQIEQFKKWKAPLSALKGFQIGQFYPYYSDYTINGTELKGAQVQLSHNKFDLSLFHGKSIVPQYQFIDTLLAPQEFTRQSSGFQLGYQPKDGRKIKLSALRFEDGKNLESLGQKGNIRNFVLSVQPEIQIHKTLKLISEFSWTKLNYLSIPDTFENPIRHNFDLLHSSAWINELEWEPTKHNMSLSIKAKRIGPQFFTAGNPFLRTNYSEYSIKFKKKFFRKKILTSLNYSYNENNLDKSQGFTTKLRGYGVLAQSLFEKAPNILISYQPFESASSYRPTSFYDPQKPWLESFSQTVKTSVLLININWVKQFKKETIQGAISYTTSSVELNQQSMRISTSTALIQGKHGDKIEYRLQHTRNSLLPAASDSSIQTMSMVQVDFSQRNIKFGSGIEYATRGPSRYFIGQSLSARLNLMGVRIEMRTTIGWLNHSFFTQVAGKTISSQITLHYSF